MWRAGSSSECGDQGGDVVMPERGRPTFWNAPKFLVSDGLVGSTLEQEPDEIGMAQIRRKVHTCPSVLQAHVDVKAKV
jgi:hypothetical protein